MSGECVHFGYAVSTRAVPINDPHLAVRSHQLRTQRKTTADTQRPKRSWIKPPQWSTRSKYIITSQTCKANLPQDVGGAADEITAVSDDDRIVIHDFFQFMQYLQRVQVLTVHFQRLLSAAPVIT